MARIALFAGILYALAALGATGARANDIEVRGAQLTNSDDGLVLDAEFAFDFNPRLGEAIANGVPLYFAVEFELLRPRWYWFDQKTAAKRLQIRLSYHALSRQYRLSTGLLQQSFGTLEEALHVLRRVRNWLVVDRSVALADASYDAMIRMRLDIGLLPKPFQVSALTSPEWHLESPWARFSFRPAMHPGAPAESREAKEGEIK